MPFTHSGFISYRRTPYGKECARLLYNELSKHEADFDHTIFLDEENYKTGYELSDTIMGGIRDSLCLLFLIVDVSITEDHPWCVYELTHFLEYEKKRIEQLKKQNPNIAENECRQIIPIFLRGDPELLPPVLKERKYIDFRKKTLCLRRNGKLETQVIQEVIQSIHRLKSHFKDFENIENIQVDKFDFQECLARLGYKHPFPKKVLSKKFPEITLSK